MLTTRNSQRKNPICKFSIAKLKTLGSQSKGRPWLAVSKKKERQAPYRPALAIGFFCSLRAWSQGCPLLVLAPSPRILAYASQHFIFDNIVVRLDDLSQILVDYLDEFGLAVPKLRSRRNVSTAQICRQI